MLVKVRLLVRSEIERFWRINVQPLSLCCSPLSFLNLNLNLTSNQQALTPQPPPPPPQLSPRRPWRPPREAKEYSRAKVADHRRRQRELSKKLELKLAALRRLPEGTLRDAALEPDLAPFPSSSAVWTDTPPIAGFATGGGMGVGMAKDDAAGEAGRCGEATEVNFVLFLFFLSFFFKSLSEKNHIIVSFFIVSFFIYWPKKREREEQKEREPIITAS